MRGREDVTLDPKLSKMFVYKFSKGKSFLLRCTLEDLQRKVSQLPLFVLVYFKSPTDTRVLGSAVVPLDALCDIAQLSHEQLVTEHAATLGKYKLLFDLTSKPIGWIAIE